MSFDDSFYSSGLQKCWLDLEYSTIFDDLWNICVDFMLNNSKFYA